MTYEYDTIEDVDRYTREYCGTKKWAQLQSFIAHCRLSGTDLTFNYILPEKEGELSPIDFVVLVVVVVCAIASFLVSMTHARSTVFGEEPIPHWVLDFYS